MDLKADVVIVIVTKHPRQLCSVFPLLISGKCYIQTHEACHKDLFFKFKLLCLWSPNNQTRISPSTGFTSLYNEVHTHTVFVSWCCDSSNPAVFSSHSFHPKSPRGRPHHSQSQCEKIRQMHDLADGRKVHGQNDIYVTHAVQSPCNRRLTAAMNEQVSITRPARFSLKH